MRYLSIILLLMATACTLTTTAPITLSPTPIDLNEEPTALPTAPIVTATVAPATGTPVADSGSQPDGNNPTCTPRTDWNFAYVVVAGDTLSKIALRANSTTAALAAGNCLTNANVISVGQMLRVPHPVSAQLPPTVVPNPDENHMGTVNISSSFAADAGNYMLLRDEVITLRWDNPPADLHLATFVIQTPGSGAITQIGEDANPTDGVMIGWKVPGGLHGNLMAMGRFLNSNLVVTSFPASVSSAPPYGLGCELTAAPGTTVSAYGDPDFNSGVFINIPPGDFHETLGRSLNGWFAVSPPNDAPYTVARLKWIPPMNNLRGRGNCPPEIAPDTGSGSVTYTNADAGLMLDYPTGWSQVGEANYVDFIAPDGRAFEIMFGQPGNTRSPEDELAACKSSPLCIGDRKILLEQPVRLPDGLNGIRLELSASLTKPDTTPAVYVFSVINNRNILFRGFGSHSSPAHFDDILNSLRLLRF